MLSRLFAVRLRDSFLLVAAVLAGSVGTAGCGNASGPPMGTVQGQVTFQGKPVQEGVVTLYSSEMGIGISEDLSGDGTYKTQQPIQVGEYVVTVFPPSEPPPVEASPVTVRREFRDIPERYRDARKSGLRLEVAEGTNSFDIEMTP